MDLSALLNGLAALIAFLTGLGDAARSLSTLQKVDDHPLYTMTIYGDYAQNITSAESFTAAATGAVASRPTPAGDSGWACSLFAALGDDATLLFGRNFDWMPSPALLLTSYPEDGYASLTMVDIAYLGFSGRDAQTVTTLPLLERGMLLHAPYLPFDGMNAAGLAIAMAAVSPGNMQSDPAKPTVDSLEIMRLILDRAASINEAIALIDGHNINFGSGPPIHYLIADATGESVLVEFYAGERHLIRATQPWQVATNFIESALASDDPVTCFRHRWLSDHLRELRGQIAPEAAMSLLHDVTQSNTQWSALYHLSSRELHVATSPHLQRPHIFSLQPNH